MEVWHFWVLYSLPSHLVKGCLFHGQSIYDPPFADVLCPINTILFIHINTSCACTIPSLPPFLTALYRVPSGSWCIYLPLGLVCGAPQFPCIVNIIRVALLQLNLLASCPGASFPRLRSIDSQVSCHNHVLLREVLDIKGKMTSLGWRKVPI